MRLDMALPHKALSWYGSLRIRLDTARQGLTDDSNCVVFYDYDTDPPGHPGNPTGRQQPRRDLTGPGGQPAAPSDPV